MLRPCSNAGGRGAPRRPSGPSHGSRHTSHRKRGAQQAQCRARALPLHRVGVHPQKMQLAVAHAHRQQDDLVGQARGGHLSVALERRQREVVLIEEDAVDRPLGGRHHVGALELGLQSQCLHQLHVLGLAQVLDALELAGGRAKLQHGGRTALHWVDELAARLPLPVTQQLRGRRRDVLARDRAEAGHLFVAGGVDHLALLIVRWQLDRTRRQGGQRHC
mmetsp:Transcript_55616/g.133264  ORF Transcript_55616/g.133264 Transcript_55616/m.133264 type:complete len:219 (+) Transcript_55616:112-768(+)